MNPVTASTLPDAVGTDTLLLGGFQMTMRGLATPNIVLPAEKDPPITIRSGLVPFGNVASDKTCDVVIPLFAPTSNGYHVPP